MTSLEIFHDHLHLGPGLSGNKVFFIDLLFFEFEVPWYAS